MAQLKTQPHGGDVTAFLNQVDDAEKRADCFTLLQMMQEVTGEPPVMWGDAMVGFGRYRYKYASGREGEWFLTGFAPRKQNLTVYIIAGFEDYEGLLARLGKHRTSVSCLYVKRLADVDLDVLRELVTRSVAHMRATNP